MDLSRLRTGERVAAVAALLLLLVMFLLTWFSVSVEEAESLSPADADAAKQAFQTGSSESETRGVETFGVNALEAYGFFDIVLILTALVALGLAVATATARTPSLPVAASAIATGLGILATLLILYSLIDTPFGFGLSLGAILGLLAALGIAAGGWLAMQDEGTKAASRRDTGELDYEAPAGSAGSRPRPDTR